MYLIKLLFQWMIFLSGLIFGWWFVWIPLTISLVWSGGAAIPTLTAALVDGYFGAWQHIPYLTLTVYALCVATLLLRPRIYTYNYA